jgi:hypothetical protein
MRRVIIESPYAGDVALNIRYARACMADSLKRGEAPYASHLLYTQEGILDDSNLEERKLGIEAGNIWREVADLTVFYMDLGMSPGMLAGYEDSLERGVLCEQRQLGGEWCNLGH